MISLEKVLFDLNKYFLKLRRGHRILSKNSDKNSSVVQLKDISAKEFLIDSRKKFNEIKNESPSEYKKFD